MDIFIFGCGGVGKEVAWIIEQINMKNKKYNLIGFLDDNEKIWNEKINGYTCFGDIDYIHKNKIEAKVVIAISNYKVKKIIVNKLNEKNIESVSIIHPNVKLHNTVKIGKGTVIYEGVIISPNVEIGNYVIISPKCGIGHDSIIGDYVSLLWNVNISGNDFIEEGVTFGSDSTMIQGKKVGRETVVGAGAVVIDNIEKNKVVVGVPAKEIKNKG